MHEKGARRPKKALVKKVKKVVNEKPQSDNMIKIKKVSEEKAITK